jgi:hypothetical protein
MIGYTACANGDVSAISMNHRGEQGAGLAQLRVS